jgi:hypothetical protein
MCDDVRDLEKQIEHYEQEIGTLVISQRPKRGVDAPSVRETLDLHV